MWLQKLKKHLQVKGYIWNPTTCTCENGKYFGSITGDSVILCHEIKDVTKTVSTKTTPTKPVPTKTVPKQTTLTKKVTCKIENFYILLTLLLIIISLLIIVSIYCYSIKHQSKQEHN